MCVRFPPKLKATKEGNVTFPEILECTAFSLFVLEIGWAQSVIPELQCWRKNLLSVAFVTCFVFCVWLALKCAQQEPAMRVFWTNYKMEVMDFLALNWLNWNGGDMVLSNNGWVKLQSQSSTTLMINYFVINQATNDKHLQAPASQFLGFAAFHCFVSLKFNILCCQSKQLKVELKWWVDQQKINLTFW